MFQKFLQNRCQARHFGGCSQPNAALRKQYNEAVRPAISAGVHSEYIGFRDDCYAVRPAISAGVHSDRKLVAYWLCAVRPAISAGVHSPAARKSYDIP